MRQLFRQLAAIVACSTLVLPPLATAQTAIPPSITTPDKVGSRLGPLEFKDGAPSPATMAKVYDNLDVGTSVAEFLSGEAKLARPTVPPPMVFHDVSGKVMNTIPPNDFSYYEMLNEVVQQEPATALDPELMGSLAAIGIIKGKPFAPDDRMKKILTEALAVANATSRSLFMNPRDPTWYYYPGSAWFNPLFVSGYEFETPIPLVTREGVKPFPPTGYANAAPIREQKMSLLALSGRPAA